MTSARALLDRFNQHRLQRFLTFVVFLSIALPAAITGSLLIYENLQRSIAQKSRATAERYADLLQAGMSLPLWNVSPNLGQPLIDSVSIDASVLKITVFSIDHQPFLNFESPQYRTTSDNNIIHIVRPVFYTEQEMGQIELLYGLEQAKEHAARETWRLVWVIIFQLLTSLIVLSYFLRKRVIIPLERLSEFAGGVSRGDLKTAAPHLLQDEFGDLSGRLENMRCALQQNFSTLEERVNQRTAELSQMNATLTGTLDQLKHTQGNLIQSEKLAALGALVAGIAHELNTPIGNGLTVATTLSQTTQNFTAQLASGITRSALDNYLNDIAEGNDMVCRNLEKASELVSGFKQVAMDRASAQRRKFNLSQFLHDTNLTMMPVYRRTPYKVIINCSESIELNSYPGPLGQVITNFLNNALIHAFEKRDAGNLQISVEESNASVVLLIADDGVGIPPENISKIFDPFFTTKLGAGGNGLGMHIVHNIVTSLLGGSIRVTSTLGQGTLFTVILPLEAPFTPDADPLTSSPSVDLIHSAD